MNSIERKLLDKMDKLVMESSGNKLKEIQEIDFLTQMDGNTFYDSYVKSAFLSNQKIKQETKNSKK